MILRTFWSRPNTDDATFSSTLGTKEPPQSVPVGKFDSPANVLRRIALLFQALVSNASVWSSTRSKYRPLTNVKQIQGLHKSTLNFYLYLVDRPHVSFVSHSDDREAVDDPLEDIAHHRPQSPTIAHHRPLGRLEGSRVVPYCLDSFGGRYEKTQGIPWVCLVLSSFGRRWLYASNGRRGTRTPDIHFVRVAL